MKITVGVALTVVAGGEYTAYEGKTCWNGQGATEIDSDDTAQSGQSEESCQGICDEDSECDCVAFRPADGTCWRRKACNPSQFGPDAEYNTYVKDGTSPPEPSPPAPPTPPGPPAPAPTPQPDGVSIRVAKGLGSRGYNSMRVSMITQQSSLHSVAHGSAWDYEDQFQNCGQNNGQNYHLGTKLVEVDPGSPTTVDVGGTQIQINIPKQGEGSVGLYVADACIYGSQWCAYADRYQMKETLQTVINALAAHDELDYWMNVGDLFYDQGGDATSDFFAGLSLEASSKIHGITMGNHDYWQNGDPGSAAGSDSFGNFHMQWYAQDAMSAKTDQSQPFDFSQDPSQYQVAAAGNFQWYNIVGNVGFIGFSNQAEWEYQSDFFQEACDYVQAQEAALVVLLGHWHNTDMGCASGLDTPDAYQKVMGIESCGSFGDRVKYFEGHRHCNFPVEDNVGFMVGSFGMGNGGCGGSDTGDGAFGLPIMDTRGDVAKLYYFELGKYESKTENFDSLLNCLQEKGLSGCTGEPGVSTWMETPIPTSKAISDRGSALLV